MSAERVKEQAQKTALEMARGSIDPKQLPQVSKVAGEYVDQNKSAIEQLVESLSAKMDEGEDIDIDAAVNGLPGLNLQERQAAKAALAPMCNMFKKKTISLPSYVLFENQKVKLLQGGTRPTHTILKSKTGHDEVIYHSRTNKEGADIIFNYCNVNKKKNKPASKLAGIQINGPAIAVRQDGNDITTKDLVF